MGLKMVPCLTTFSKYSLDVGVVGGRLTFQLLMMSPNLLKSEIQYVSAKKYAAPSSSGKIQMVPVHKLYAEP